jgi:ribonuclease E
VIIRAVRDYLRDDVDQVLIDSPEAHKQAMDFVSMVMPQVPVAHQAVRRQHPPFQPLSDRKPDRDRFRARGAPALRRFPGHRSRRKRWCPSISTRPAPRKGRTSRTRLYRQTSKPQTRVARQLRLRDIGGLIVIDFIDMLAAKNQRAVENRMRQALEVDRARVQIGKYLAFRPPRDVPSAPPPLSRRDKRYRLSALRRPGHDSRHQVPCAVDSASHRGRSDQGAYLRGSRSIVPC